MGNQIQQAVEQITGNRVYTDLSVKCTLDIIEKLNDSVQVLRILMDGQIVNIHEYVFSGLVISMLNASLAQDMSSKSEGNLSLFEAHEIIASFGSIIDIEKLMKLREE